MPNGGGTKSRVGAALSHDFVGAEVAVLERDSGVEFSVKSEGFSGMRDEEKRRRVLDALREDGGDHLHGARVEHLGSDQFRIVPPAFAVAESQVVTIRVIAPNP